MDIILGTTADEKNKLHKTFDNQVTFSGFLREESSVITPTVTIEAVNLSGYNYMYIPSFGRYYFIKDIASVRTNLWRVKGSVDVLMSFADGLETCPIILSDEESETDDYMSGNPWATTVKAKTDIINFPYGLNDTGEYILITSGG